MSVELRAWQTEAITRWLANGRRGVFEVTTGAGKTICAIACIEKFWEYRDTGHVVILVPSIALADQWYINLETHLGSLPGGIEVYGAGRKPARPSAINIMVVNTGREWAPRITQQSATFLIADECHKYASPANARALAGRHLATLGLSATPRRQYDSRFEEYVVPRLGPVIFEYGLVAAQRDSILVEPTIINVGIDLSDDEQEVDDAQSRRIGVLSSQVTRGAVSQHALERALFQRANARRNAIARLSAAAYLLNAHRNDTCIVFHETIQGAEALRELLAVRKHRVTIYHSKLGSDLRRDNLRLFMEGTFDVLVACRAIDEGFDFPRARIAVIASGSKSIRQRIQRIGRVLRSAPDKEDAIIYTIYLNDLEEEALLQADAKLGDSFDIRWQRIK